MGEPDRRADVGAGRQGQAVDRSSLVRRRPANGSTGVPTNPLIRVQFNKQVAVTSANVELYPASVGLSIILPGTLVVSANGLSASFTPTMRLSTR